MSGFSGIALPGSIPTAGGGKSITPDSIFTSPEEKARYKRLIEQGRPGTPVRVKKVKVEIFDLSDKKDVKAYEKLWAELLEKASRMEVVIDHHKDLVHRPDGTSYWMKYVEYVEFGDGSEDKDKKSNSEGK